MRNLFIIISLVLLASCGKEEVYITKDTKPFDDLSVKVSNIEAYNFVQDAKTNALEQRVDALETLINATIYDLNNVKNSVTNLQVTLDGLNNTITNVAGDLNDLELALDNQQEQIDNLESIINSSTVSLQNQINTNYNSTVLLLNSLQNQINNSQNNTISIIQICNTNENVLKLNNNYYAVYMVSNAFGTYLGKLSQNVQYRTTDSSKQDFHINSNNQIICN